MAYLAGLKPREFELDDAIREARRAIPAETKEMNAAESGWAASQDPRLHQFRASLASLTVAPHWSSAYGRMRGAFRGSAVDEWAE